MAYNYYRTSVPGWGTSQFQFGPPWAPSFQPQPSWGGLDFYNAHAVNPDPSLYSSVMARAPEFSAMGIGHRHARRWHSQVYSGLAPLSQLLPTDIGAAAAYEMYRTWKHNSFLYEPLTADRAQQREGLIGMAIAEATRLWQYTGRPMDVYGLRAACEAAAAAASVLADRLLSRLGSYGSFGAGASPYMASGGLSYAGTPIPGTPASLGIPGAGFDTPLPGASPLLGASGAMLQGGGSPYPAGAALPGGYGAGGNMQTVPPGSTIIVDRPRSRHSHRHGGHHHHHHHHHRRSRSVDVVRPGGGYSGYGGYGGGGYGGYGGYGGTSGYGGYGGGYGGYGGGYDGGGYGMGGYGAGGYGGGLAQHLAAGVGAGLNATGFGYGRRY